MRCRSRAAVTLAVLVALSLLAAFAVTAPGFAATVTNQRPLLFNFDGTGTTAGRFRVDPSQTENQQLLSGLGAVAFDDSTGSLYAIDSTAEAVDKFNALGEAEDFAAGPAAGTSSLYGPGAAEPFKAQDQFFFGGATIVAVDNSGGLGGAGEGEQGRLYVGSGGKGPIDAFDKEGRFLWSILPQFEEEELRGFTVDAEGRLWVSFGKVVDEEPQGEVLELDTTGTGAPSATPIREIEITSGTRLPAGLAIDKTGEDLYVADDRVAVSNATQGFDRYVNGVFDSTVSSEPMRAVAIDQREAGHVFAVAGSPAYSVFGASLYEYEPCPTPGCSANLLDSSEPSLIGDGRGVAYNHSRNWVYVPDHLTETVKVFGPRASGPVPVVSIGESEKVTKTEATVNGTVNPAGLPNTYHFEWVRAEVQKIVIESSGKPFRLQTQCGRTNTLSFDISAAALQGALEPCYGPGNIEVTGTATSGGAPGEYRVLFEGELAGRFVGQLSGTYVNPENPEINEGSVQAAEISRGQLWAESAQQRTRPESYPAIEPTDSSNHAVSQQLGGLQPNTAYDVRLVGTSTEPEGDPEKRLDDYSTSTTFTTLPPDPPSVSNLTLSDVTTSSAHLAATIDPKGDETTWRVFLDSEPPHGVSQTECATLPLSAYGLASEGTIPFGEPNPVVIETQLSGLERGETYCLRLVARNGNPQPGVANAALATEAVRPDEIVLAFAAPRTDTSARLNAYVNPEGDSPLTYRFEYSPDGTTWTALSEEVSTTDAHSQIVVGEELGGLTPDTTYFYRLGLVKNEAEVPKASLEKEEKSFTTRTTAEMTIAPNAFGETEKRGMELINRPDKGDQNARAAELYTGASPLRSDGEEFLWTVLGGAPGANSGTQATFLAKRSGSGWVSQGLVPPASQQVGGGGLAFYPVAESPDFSRFVFAALEPAVLGSSPPIFVRADEEGNQQVLHSFQTPVGRNVDATTNTAHVLVEDPDNGRLEDIGSGSVEEISLVPPASSPIGVPQAGGTEPACALGRGGGGGSFTGGSPEGGAGSQFERGYHRMAFTDASRVYFQVHPDSDFPACSGGWAIYERNREAELQTTTPIVPPALATVDTAMIRATPDGRSLYFVTSAKLVAADGNNHVDVYRWDEEAGKSICLTCNVKNELGRTITDANLEMTGGIARRVLISDDFSHIYFNSPKRLVAGRGVEAAEAEGGNNLYVYNGSAVSFVASGVPLNNSASLSSDGNVLTFLSTSAHLTGDQIAAQCPELDQPGRFGPCQELYRYDARDGSIECLSCRHDDTTTNSVSLTSFGEPFQVSADGDTAAFVTAQALVSGDVNNSADLYEWRDGRVRLLTDGLTRYPTGLAGPIPQAIDEGGQNIIFSVAAPGLTGFEHDGLANLYDARIGGGFTPPNPPAHCFEESCQGPLQAAPTPAPLGTSTYHGPGDRIARPKCPKGKARRHARCVKKPHRKHSRRHRSSRR